MPARPDAEATLGRIAPYVAVEAAIPDGSVAPLFGLLIGVNVAPLVASWASLATLLWWERCRSAGVRVPLGRFVITGAVTAVVATTAALLTLR